jgi:hypothetical protein
MEPFEIVCAPYQCYAAPVGTELPELDADVDVTTDGWVLVGTSGDKNYDDAGVTVSHTETLSTFTPAGSTTPRKAWRTGEVLTIGFTLADLSVDQYALVMDQAEVTEVAATTTTAGSKTFELMRGINVKMYAVVLRGLSPEDESLNAQYQVPAAYQSGNPAPVFSKNGPAELAVEFTAFELTPGVFGQFTAQTPKTGP